MRKKITLTPDERRNLIYLVTVLISRSEKSKNDTPEFTKKLQDARETLDNLIPVTESEYLELFFNKPDIRRPENCINPQIGKCFPHTDRICEHCMSFKRGVVYGGIEGKLEQLRKQGEGIETEPKKEVEAE